MPVDAFYVDEANHGPGAAADFDKVASITLVVRSLRHRCQGKERQQLKANLPLSLFTQSKLRHQSYVTARFA